MRCVHCRKAIKKKTKDHVFPRSWYPKTTPANVQRWTVPSCADCNGKFGELEKELFIKAAMCVGPVKAEAAGLSRKAVESLGVGVLATSRVVQMAENSSLSALLHAGLPATINTNTPRPQESPKGRKQESRCLRSGRSLCGNPICLVLLPTSHCSHWSYTQVGFLIA
jgi:hypothetical protein